MSEFLPSPSPDQSPVELPQNLTHAQQLGLEDGKFDVVRNSGAIEKGWSVDGIRTKIVDGVEKQVVDISTPQFDDEGSRLYLEDGTPNDLTKYGLLADELLAMQKVDSVEIGEVSETEQALEEIGSMAVKTEVELQDGSVSNSAAAKVLQAQIDSRDEWVENKVDLKPEVSENNEAVKTFETAESTETSESMNQAFESVNEQIRGLADEAGPLVDKISGAPNQFNAQVEQFLSILERNFTGLGNSVRTVRSLLNAAETGFMFDLKMNPSLPVTNQDMQAVQNLRNVVSRVATELESIGTQVEQTQQQGTYEQSSLGENLGELTRGIVREVDDFSSTKVRGARIAVDEAGAELTRKAYEDLSLEDDSKSGVNGSDENHMDKLSHISGRLNKETNYLVDDVETADRAVASKLGINSQDFTRNILNAARLHPRTIGDLSTDLKSVVTTLDMVSNMNQGSKGQLHAEIGFGVKQAIERAFEQISIFREPTVENPDVQTDIGSARNKIKEMADASVRYLSQLQQLVRDSEIER